MGRYVFGTERWPYYCTEGPATGQQASDEFAGEPTLIPNSAVSVEGVERRALFFLVSRGRLSLRANATRCSQVQPYVRLVHRGVYSVQKMMKTSGCPVCSRGVSLRNAYSVQRC